MTSDTAWPRLVRMPGAGPLEELLRSPLASCEADEMYLSRLRLAPVMIGIDPALLIVFDLETHDTGGKITRTCVKSIHETEWWADGDRSDGLLDDA